MLYHILEIIDGLRTLQMWANLLPFIVLETAALWAWEFFFVGK